MAPGGGTLLARFLKPSAGSVLTTTCEQRGPDAESGRHRSDSQTNVRPCSRDALSPGKQAHQLTYATSVNRNSCGVQLFFTIFYVRLHLLAYCLMREFPAYGAPVLSWYEPLFPSWASWPECLEHALSPDALC